MSHDDPLDLSALDPERDPGRWRALITDTLVRLDAVLEERARRDDPLHLIAAWRKPVLAAAAAVILILIPLEIALERRETWSERVERLVALSYQPLTTQLPTGGDFRRALGEPRP
jgi:hypothetical protein